MTFNYSGFYIRDLIYNKILDNSFHELLFSFNSNPLISFPTTLKYRHQLTNDPNFLFAYHFTNLAALEVGKHFYEPIRYNHNPSGVCELVDSLTPVYNSDCNQTYMVEVLMQNDLNKVNLFFATVAWLSIDNFRWHNLPQFSHIPEDLSYGLVSDYPDLIFPYAAFISNVNRYPNLELLPSETLDDLESVAHLSAMS